MVERLRAVPGIEQAGSGQAIPFSGGGSGEYFQRAGTGGDEGLTLGRMDFVSPGYLEALGARVRAGRLINSEDSSALAHA